MKTPHSSAHASQASHTGAHTHIYNHNHNHQTAHHSTSHPLAESSVEEHRGDPIFNHIAPVENHDQRVVRPAETLNFPSSRSLSSRPSDFLPSSPVPVEVLRARQRMLAAANGVRNMVTDQDGVKQVNFLEYQKNARETVKQHTKDCIDYCRLLMNSDPKPVFLLGPPFLNKTAPQLVNSLVQQGFKLFLTPVGEHIRVGSSEVMSQLEHVVSPSSEFASLDPSQEIIYLGEPTYVERMYTPADFLTQMNQAKDLGTLTVVGRKSSLLFGENVTLHARGKQVLEAMAGGRLSSEAPGEHSTNIESYPTNIESSTRLKEQLLATTTLKACLSVLLRSEGEVF